MRIENDFITFRPEELPKGPWLLFAPHSDDESFGMGGTLLLARKQKIDVVVVILTDGALGGEKDNVSNIRKKETEKVAEILNLQALEFWQQPDRELIKSERLVNKTVDCIKRHKPTSIFFPALGEYHPDHRATAFIVWQAMRKGQHIATMYSYEISTQQQPVNLLIDISAVFEEKKQLMQIYQSQLEENNYDEIVGAINKSRTYSLEKKYHYAEAFYQFDAIDQHFNHKMLERFQLYLEQDL